MMIDIICFQNHTGELGEKIILFIRGARRAHNSNRLPAFHVTNSRKRLADQLKRLFPRRRSQLAVLANERLRQPFFMIRKIKTVSPLDAEEIPVRAALVAIVPANNFHPRIRASHAQSRLAPVSAVGADRAHMLHLPWPRLVAIRAGSQCPHRADVDAHPALFALQMIFLIRRNDRTHATVLHSQRPNIHSFAAHAHTPKTKNAPRTIEEHHWRPLLLLLMILGLHELRFGRTIRERHVLQFAFAARIAYRAIQRMISQQDFNRGFPCLLDLFALRSDDHSFADHRGTSGLQLGHLLDLHHAHAASATQRESGVIAERRHFNTRALASLDQQRPRRGRHLFSVNRKCYVSHKKILSVPAPAVLPPRPLFHTDTACLPDDLQTLCETSSRTRLLASPPRPQEDKTFFPACSPPGIACCRYLF